MKLFTDSEIPAETSDTVNAAIKRGRLPCSILLSGGSEKLRRKCAFELSCAALCPNETPPSEEPCGKCNTCKRVMMGLHPDVTEVIPDDGKKLVSVNTVRQKVLASLYASPTEGENKVYIFPEADNLPSVVQNALLKSIEEPPDDTLFIFCCDQRESLLTTVISRLTEYHLGETLSSSTRKNDEKITETANNIALSIANDDEFSLMLKLSVMHKNRKMMGEVAQKLIIIIRDAMTEGSGAELFSGCDTAAYALSRSYKTSSLLKIKEIMDIIVSEAAANANENLLITRFCSLLAEVMKERI